MEQLQTLVAPFPTAVCLASPSMRRPKLPFEVSRLSCFPLAPSTPLTTLSREVVTNGLTAELAPFGIRVYMFEPGRFRTNFGSHGVFASPDPQGFNKHYQGTVVDQILTFLKSAPPASGNPDEAALRMWEVVTGTGMGGGFAEVPRIPLGSDAVDSMGETGKEWSDLAEKTAQIARSTDFKE